MKLWQNIENKKIKLKKKQIFSQLKNNIRQNFQSVDNLQFKYLFNKQNIRKRTILYIMMII